MLAGWCGINRDRANQEVSQSCSNDCVWSQTKFYATLQMALPVSERSMVKRGVLRGAILKSWSYLILSIPPVYLSIEIH